MSLVWHLVKSDLRRLRWPLAVWAAAFAMNVAGNAYELTLASPLVPGLWPVIDSLTLISFVTRWGLTIALAAQIIQADPVCGPAAFWPTRPIGGARLFGAKAAALAVLVLAPALADAVVVAGFGFSGRVVLVAFVESAGTGAMVVVAAAAFASVAETFGSFVLRSIIILFAGGMVAGLASALALMSRRLGSGTAPTDTLIFSGLWAFRLAVVAGGTAFVGWRYCQRHARLGLLIAILGTASLLVVPSFWPWDFFGGAEGDLPAPTLALRSPALLSLPGGSVNLTGEAECAAQPDGTFLEPVTISGEVRLRWPGGGTQRLMGMSGNSLRRLSLAHSEPDLLRRVLAPLRLLNPPPKDPLALSLALVDAATAGRLARTPADLEAGIIAQRRRYVIEAEMPLQAGAVAHGGTWRARIEAVDGPGRLTVTEDAYLSQLTGEPSLSDHLRLSGIPVALGPRPPGSVFYLLVNRVRGEALLAQRREGTLVTSFGRLCAWRHTLEFPIRLAGAPSEDWLRDATLLRVRAENLGGVTCTLRAVGVTAKL